MVQELPASVPRDLDRRRIRGLSVPDQATGRWRMPPAARAAPPTLRNRTAIGEGVAADKQEMAPQPLCVSSSSPPPVAVLRHAMFFQQPLYVGKALISRPHPPTPRPGEQTPPAVAPSVSTSTELGSSACAIEGFVPTWRRGCRGTPDVMTCRMMLSIPTELASRTCFQNSFTRSLQPGTAAGESLWRMIFASLKQEPAYTRPLYGIHAKYTFSAGIELPYFLTAVEIGRAIDELKIHDEVPPASTVAGLSPNFFSESWMRTA